MKDANVASSQDLAPQVRLELTTLRLTAECSAIELLRNKKPFSGEGKRTVFITSGAPYCNQTGFADTAPQRHYKYRKLLLSYSGKPDTNLPELPK